MKNVLRMFVIVFITATLFFSCQKYEDGPFISLRTKTDRLEGFWADDTATITITWDNGCHDYKLYKIKRFYDFYYFRDKNNLTYISSLSLIYDINDYDAFVNCYGTPKEVVLNDTTYYFTNLYTKTGDWEWIDGKESLSITFADKSEKWDILKLTDDEMNVEVDPYGGYSFKKMKFKNDDDFIEELTKVDD